MIPDGEPLEISIVCTGRPERPHEPYQLFWFVSCRVLPNRPASKRTGTKHRKVSDGNGWSSEWRDGHYSLRRFTCCEPDCGLNLSVNDDNWYLLLTGLRMHCDTPTHVVDLYGLARTLSSAGL